MDMTYQFGYQIVKDGKRGFSTAGLSALEHAFDVLMWNDPHYVSWGGCNASKCNEWATSGTPTDNGYKWFCSKHMKEYNETANIRSEST